MEQHIKRLQRAAMGFLRSDRVAEQLRGIPSDIRPTFLQSFPRSGNGFFRFVTAKAALAANGYDLANMTEERRHYFGPSGTAWVFIAPSGEEISIEEIATDLHMNSVEHVASLETVSYTHLTLPTIYSV